MTRDHGDRDGNTSRDLGRITDSASVLTSRVERRHDRVGQFLIEALVGTAEAPTEHVFRATRSSHPDSNPLAGAFASGSRGTTSFNA